MSGRAARATALRLTRAAEDAVEALLVAVLGLVGRHRVTVLPFIGHGSPDRLHVRARVVLGSRALPDPETPSPIRTVGHDNPTAADAEPTSRATTGADAAGTEVRAVRPASAEDGSDEHPRSPSPANAGARSGAEVASSTTSASTTPTAAPAATVQPSRWSTLRSSIGQFLTLELPRCPVTVLVSHGRAEVRCDREGYVDALVETAGLAPGWHEVVLQASWRGHRAEVVAPVLVVDPEARLALISDVDDTVIETGIARGLELLRLTLLTDVSRRVPLPGAAELYRALTDPPGGPPRPTFYLSTSPWNLHDLLARFIALRGFPRGPLLLTDWGPGHGSFLRISAEQHKLTLIRCVLADHPGLDIVLVGDTGQLDPEIYATIAAEAPDRVRAIYVRRTAWISPSRTAEVDALAARVTASGVPMLAVDDSSQIAEHAVSLGLLDPAAIPSIRAASSG